MFFKIAFLITLLLSSLSARSLEEIHDSNEIIIAVYENFPPYSYMEDGIAKGIDIELGELLAKSLNVKPKWYWTGSDENLEDDLRKLNVDINKSSENIINGINLLRLGNNPVKIDGKDIYNIISKN